MKKNYFKKIAAIVAAASLCTASLISVSAADQDKPAKADQPIFYDIEDVDFEINDKAENVVSLNLNFNSPAGKTFDSYGGLMVELTLPEGVTYLGKKDSPDKNMQTTLVNDNPNNFIMSGGSANISNDSPIMTTLNFNVDGTKVKAGDKVDVKFTVTKTTMTSNTNTGDKYKGVDAMGAFFADGSINITAKPVETTTEATTTPVVTTTTKATTTTVATTTAATTTTAAATTTVATTEAPKVTTTPTQTVPSAPKTGESTDGVVALAATIVAAAGAAVVLRKKKD